MNAHTPGPHHAGHQTFKNEREKGDPHFSIFDSHSACLAHVFGKGDAVLYAAAPDLLAACEAAIASHDERRQFSDVGGVTDSAADRLRAAIAAAKGTR